MNLNLETNIETRLGQKVLLGDLIQGKSTHLMVVKFNTKLQKFEAYICEQGLENISHDLKDIINAWSDLEVKGNINLID